MPRENRTMSAHRAAAFRWTLILSALLLPSLASAAAMDVSLTFATLPSAQGWSYAAVGAHAGVAEAAIYSVTGAELHMNSMGQSNGVSGGSILYNLLAGITNTESKQMRVRARCLQVEGSTNAPVGQGGFFFGFTVNNANYGASITPTKVCILLSTGYFVFATNYDNSTAFHDYLLEFVAPTTSRIYRDGVLIGSSTAGFPVAQTNRASIGDGTGGANAQVEIRQVRVVQDVATATAATTWSRIKELYR
jgi:hypothetical protein